MAELPGILAVIAQEVGDDKALAIGRRLAGAECYFPSLSTIQMLQRNARVTDLADKGLAAPEIAARLDLSERHVYRIISEKNQKK